ncbi:MaoC family dehydratase N-terminal domain-containing protein [Chloroflexota bacterium]
MTEGSLITGEIKKAIGMEFGPFVYEVEKGAIRDIAGAIGDPNPLWQNVEYAKAARYGGIIASPTFLFALRIDEVTQRITTLKCPLKDELNGGSEIEYLAPIRPGDVITVRAKINDVLERQGRSGKLLFFYIDVTYENQKGELVIKHRFNFIRY